MVSRVIPVAPFDLVVFGATGDLARRKLLPALFRRHLVGQMPAGARVIGAARSAIDAAGFRAMAAEALAEFAGGEDGAGLAAFLDALDYVALDVAGDSGWDALAAKLEPGRVRAFYLSVAPSLFGPIADRLDAAGLITPESRIVVEKPFGHDLASARELNARLARHFAESQIFRIDHYLGKETVQNLMAVRFANALFEPLWNARHVDHVQITVAETLGVAGRGAYYDATGAMRDMVQNHLMQLLCLIAMEPPARFEADAVRDEKLKVIRALEPLDPRPGGARPVPGRQWRPLLCRGGGQSRQPHRKLRGAEGGDRQLALGRHALLSAHRKAAAGAAVRDRRRLPRSAPFDLRPPGAGAARQCADHPPANPTRESPCA
ncbi:MAG: hypothetical protein KatS3mg118_2073 [Paracoccaceae bacterium]|nr:MAG: hypothetical protein KatS3mg118_2073 [Paracoccaceae bacterium]